MVTVADAHRRARIGGRVSVRQHMLAVLAEGPRYGHQLHADIRLRTGGWRVNAGQIYTTLDRLERDGLIEELGTDEAGRTLYTATELGRAESARWWSEGDIAEERDGLAARIAAALSLPGVDASLVIRTETNARRARANEIAEEIGALSAMSGEEARTRAFVLAAAAHRIAAEQDWLDSLAENTDLPRPVPLSTEQPRRGRPARPAHAERPADLAGAHDS